MFALDVLSRTVGFEYFNCEIKPMGPRSRIVHMRPKDVLTDKRFPEVISKMYFGKPTFSNNIQYNAIKSQKSTLDLLDRVLEAAKNVEYIYEDCFKVDAKEHLLMKDLIPQLSKRTWPDVAYSILSTLKSLLGVATLSSLSE